MALTAQTYGMIPYYHPSGQDRARQFNILPAYTTAIYEGSLVKINGTGGGIELGDGTTDALGVFAGVEYIDPTGKPVVSNTWPGTASCTNIRAFVYCDPVTVYKVGVSANGSNFTQDVIGGAVDIFSPTTGSTTTGKSTSSVQATPGAAVAQVQVLQFVENAPYDATTNPFPELLVRLAQSQVAGDKTGV
jgi:hypothetical protein